MLQNRMLWGVVLLLSAILGRAEVVAQNSWYGSSIHQNLSENQTYIRGCRDIIPGTQADVYTNSDLLNGPNAPIETLQGGQQVRLTGVLRKLPRYTAVQVYLDDFVFANSHPVGWVDASKLSQTTQTCYP
jgi:hypothetical protein